eukprot:TRINITY_DN67173_c0_g1_i1.p1 TRINITY_DN67173_c0_g1~~TRINITY_DN67173_c0_g1_i1.p1  ORF type:complete len:914 (-),score=104.65 TRINITY_DN67173_c0_g1_i1:195-2936(-)
MCGKEFPRGAFVKSFCNGAAMRATCARFRLGLLWRRRRWSFCIVALVCHATGEVRAIPSTGLILPSLVASAFATLMPVDVTVGDKPFQCASGTVPKACMLHSLVSVDWQRFLELVCHELVSRTDAAQAALDILSKFDKHTGQACLEGLIVIVLVLAGTGAEQWHDQIIRFLPDGRVRLGIGVWEVLDRGARFNQWSVTAPQSLTLRPPFPPWPFPGIFFDTMRKHQDFVDLTELPASSRCKKDALEKLPGCDERVWRVLLGALCHRCTPDLPHGLPCFYENALIELLTAIFESQHDRLAAPTCGHGFLAAVLSLGSRVAEIPIETDPNLWRVRQDTGTVNVINACFRRLLGNYKNRFSVNVPVIDLSPFPFHVGALWSARPFTVSDDAYYEEFLGFVARRLARAGLQHVLLPGDASQEGAQVRASQKLSSFFLPFELRATAAVTLQHVVGELKDKFGSIFRVIGVSAGLWQLGEEPSRFSPHIGVAFRVFCKECVHVSFYFYTMEGSESSLLPLAAWKPCLIPRERVFPARLSKMGGDVANAVPAAADQAWLRHAQRRPAAWVPNDATLGPCYVARRRAAERLQEETLTSPSQASAAAGVMQAPLRHPPLLSPEFDLSPGIHADLGLFDLMRLREDSEREGLRRYSDKVLFKTRLLREGMPVPRILFMSGRQRHDLLDVLRGLGTKRFVAKPTHLAASSFVFAMRDGVNLVSGQPASLQEIAAGLEQSRSDSHVDDWATESIPPGVIIEELISPSTNSRPETTTPDELKCHTFFGELFFCEWVFVRNMTSGEDGSTHFWSAHQRGDRAQPTLGHRTLGIPNFQSRGLVFRDGTCCECEERLPLSQERWASLVRIVERLAESTDHIRIDLFITPDGGFVVNEANISILAISGLPPEIISEMARRWVDGYRLMHE